MLKTRIPIWPTASGALPLGTTPRLRRVRHEFNDTNLPTALRYCGPLHAQLDLTIPLPRHKHTCEVEIAWEKGREHGAAVGSAKAAWHSRSHAHVRLAQTPIDHVTGSTTDLTEAIDLPVEPFLHRSAMGSWSCLGPLTGIVSPSSKIIADLHLEVI